MTISSELLKAVMRNYPTGVTIVTTTYNDEYYGLTVNSFTSLSLDPPLVLIAIDKRLASHEAIDKSNVYAVNILSDDMKDLAIKFATAPREERFSGLKVKTAKTGSPIIEGAIAYLDCKVVAKYPGGDHTIFIGEILDAQIMNNKVPLIYYNRGYYSIKQAVPIP
ncbi:flavin reductase domain protein FMN-binding protein [Vulcanisaeta moutnovskia 768-28]|uniref:Flavin reductase domain protein FMN-binding protein n=1 Tax=Vulcanisaeta moutnovskia (strain 768-28) TaxID=985053 RepID=F0QUK4_VULM7|nr:flavin reductase family protein [Vulcanisaeta moutnovskia]ADY00665.1 flavin reductase domain protein FMN-binding protein [Vulcanisaeta moutnovskia 768-28]